MPPSAEWSSGEAVIFSALAHLYFGESFAPSEASLWPGSKDMVRKKHRRGKNYARGLAWFRNMGRAARAPGHAKRV